MPVANGVTELIDNRVHKASMLVGIAMKQGVTDPEALEYTATRQAIIDVLRHPRTGKRYAKAPSENTWSAAKIILGGLIDGVAAMATPDSARTTHRAR